MIVLCIGRKEQGKTTLAYHLLSFMPKRVVFDPREDFQTSDVIAEPADVYADLQDTEVDEVIVQSTRNVEETFAETTFQLADWLKDHKGDPFGYLVDDSRLVLQTKKIPDDFSWMLRSTKVDQSRIILTTWRAVDVPLEIRSQADHWMIFKTTELRDLEVIRERFGDETAERVKVLEPHVYLHADDSGPELTVTEMRDSKEWYVNIHELQGMSKEREKYFVRA